MKNHKGDVYTSSYPAHPPEWYWVAGLHDACIVGVESFEFPFDYSKFSGKKNPCDKNLFLLKINASGALGDADIREIKLFNYEIITKNFNLLIRKEMWWLADRLTEKDGYYYLEIDLQCFDCDPEDFTFKIKFKRAEVVRK